MTNIFIAFNGILMEKIVGLKIEKASSPQTSRRCLSGGGGQTNLLQPS
jgi:hypothetical protein